MCAYSFNVGYLGSSYTDSEQEISNQKFLYVTNDENGLDETTREIIVDSLAFGIHDKFSEFQSVIKFPDQNIDAILLKGNYQEKNVMARNRNKRKFLMPQDLADIKKNGYIRGNVYILSDRPDLKQNPQGYKTLIPGALDFGAIFTGIVKERFALSNSKYTELYSDLERMESYNSLSKPIEDIYPSRVEKNYKSLMSNNTLIQDVLSGKLDFVGIKISGTDEIKKFDLNKIKQSIKSTFESMDIDYDFID